MAARLPLQQQLFSLLHLIGPETGVFEGNCKVKQQMPAAACCAPAEKCLADIWFLPPELRTLALLNGCKLADEMCFIPTLTIGETRSQKRQQ